MHHGRAVPMERPRQSINQVALHTAPLKFRCEAQTSGPRTNHKYRSRHASAVGDVVAGPPFLQTYRKVDRSFA